MANKGKKSLVESLKFNSYADVVSGDDKAVSEVPLKDLHDFKDHPFKVNADTEDMKELVESIRQNGVLTAGTVRLFGGDPTVAATRARIGYMPEMAYYYPYLTVRELLSFYGGVCGMDKRLVRSRTDELLEAVELVAAAKRPLKTYSKGMLQRAGIAQALLNDPDLLILDEPFTGLDPLARIHFRALLKKLRDQGKSIFFSSHELGETELLCDNVAIMKEGRCIYHGPVDRLAGDGGGNLERLFLDVLEKGGVA